MRKKKAHGICVLPLYVNTHAVRYLHSFLPFSRGIKLSCDDERDLTPSGHIFLCRWWYQLLLKLLLLLLLLLSPSSSPQVPQVCFIGLREKGKLK
jgi:hypothetical protein